MVHADKAIELLRHAALGTDPGELDGEEQSLFDEILSELAQMKSDGVQVDMPFEFPDPPEE